MGDFERFLGEHIRALGEDVRKYRLELMTSIEKFGYEHKVKPGNDHTFWPE
jgi:hypothetical protein